ncbi:MAG: S8 family serine peptidase [Planctomycetota bacterium]|nr:S8 family serine peptidase [Planctomycetota bacterium]
MLRETRNGLTAGMLMSACLLLFGHCGPGDPGNSNTNDNDNGNDNGGTGNTVDDLPDLSSDDAFGTGEGADVFVPGLILVGFDQGLTGDTFLQVASSTATALNGTLVDIIPDIQVVTLAVASGSEGAAITLAQQLFDVEYAEANFAGRVAAIDGLIPTANSAQFAQYQLFTTNAIKARGLLASGSGGVSVAVLDTGCTLTHSEFSASALFGGANYVSGSTNVSDDFPGGHGTAVVSLLAAGVNSGVMAGLLPGFDVTVHKVCDGSGLCTLDAVVVGIIGALNGNADFDITDSEIPLADVINMSFSFSADYRSLARAIFEAERRGVVMVAAAGNNGRSTAATDERYPAGYSTVLSVGATDIVDTAAPFSNRSAEVEVVAPGVDLLVAGSAGGYGFVDGTSYAAAQVAAAAAWLLESDGDLTPFDVRTRLNERGDALPTGSGFDQTSARRLNFYAALLNQEAPPEAYLIPDSDLTAAAGVALSTLVSSQASSGSTGPIAEAFADEQIYWYGYFPGGDVSFELIDDGQSRSIAPESVVPSSIDLFLEFLRGIELGESVVAIGILQQAVFVMPDLGGERRAVDIIAIADGIESSPRTFIYNPLQKGYNIISYKNFESSVLHLRDEEGESFDPSQADIQLLGFGDRPEINWAGGQAAERVQLGSSLDPAYFVVSGEEDDQLLPPIRLGDCVGAAVAEQICGEQVGLPENEIARILVRIAENGGTRTATIEVIYVP